MRDNLLSSGKSMHHRVVSGFNKADEEKYRLDQIKVFEMLPQEDKDVFLEEWSKKISASSKKGKNRLRNLVFLKSTAKEMNIYFRVGYNLELAELDEYLEYSIKNENTAETAILLEYKNKTFDSDYLEEVETRKEMVEIGLEMPTLKELREKWSVKVEKDYIKIVGYKGKDGNETLPEAIDTGKQVRVIGIGDTAYNGHTYMNLETLRLPEGIEEIQSRTFRDTHLKEINFPSTLKSIGEQAFLMSQITELTLPNGLTVVEKATFMQCKHLLKVTLSNTIKEIKELAFDACIKMVEIHLSEQLELIGSQALNYCISLEQIKLPKNLKKVEERAFAKCEKLKRVILEGDTIDIDSKAFVDCKSLEFIGTDGGENIIDRFIIKE